jgi:hypothetical protein
MQNYWANATKPHIISAIFYRENDVMPLGVYMTDPEGCRISLAYTVIFRGIHDGWMRPGVICTPDLQAVKAVKVDDLEYLTVSGEARLELPGVQVFRGDRRVQ